MNRINEGNWNTIMMSFPWFDVRDDTGTPARVPPELMFLAQILSVTVPEDCQNGSTPTGTSADDAIALPPRTALHPNVPNPFNPTTTIRFGLAGAGRVRLRIFDVSGRLVRSLSEGDWPRGRHTLLWNGLDDAGGPVASGVYLCRLDAPDARAVRKLLLA